MGWLGKNPRMEPGVAVGGFRTEQKPAFEVLVYIIYYVSENQGAD